MWRGRKSWPNCGRRALVALSVVAIASACSTTVHTPPPETNEVARANYLIDQKQYSEAIFVLEDRVKKTPDDLKARTLLSSAYASRAGLQVANYTAFAHEIDKWNQIDELLPTEDDGEWTQTLAKIAFRLQVAIRAFEALPTMQTPQALQDIQTSVRILVDGGRIQGGPSIYRALLRVVEFKHELYTVDRPKFVDSCRIEPEELARWLTEVTKTMTLIIDDVAFGLADPGARERTLGISRKLEGDLQRVLNENLRPLLDLGLPSVKLPKPMDVPSLLKKVYGGCG